MIDKVEFNSEETDSTKQTELEKLGVTDKSNFLARLFARNTAMIKDTEMFEAAIALGHPTIAQAISEILAGNYDDSIPIPRKNLIGLYKNMLVFLLLEPNDQIIIRKIIRDLVDVGINSVPGIHDLNGMLHVIDGSHYIQKMKEEGKE